MDRLVVYVVMFTPGILQVGCSEQQGQATYTETMTNELAATIAMSCVSLVVAVAILILCAKKGKGDICSDTEKGDISAVGVQPMDKHNNNGDDAETQNDENTQCNGKAETQATVTTSEETHAMNNTDKPSVEISESVGQERKAETEECDTDDVREKQKDKSESTKNPEIISEDAIKLSHVDEKPKEFTHASDDSTNKVKNSVLGNYDEITLPESSDGDDVVIGTDKSEDLQNSEKKEVLSSEQSVISAGQVHLQNTSETNELLDQTQNFKNEMDQKDVLTDFGDSTSKEMKQVENSKATAENDASSEVIGEETTAPDGDVVPEVPTPSTDGNVVPEVPAPSTDNDEVPKVPETENSKQIEAATKSAFDPSVLYTKIKKVKRSDALIDNEVYEGFDQNLENNEDVLNSATQIVVGTEHEVKTADLPDREILGSNRLSHEDCYDEVENGDTPSKVRDSEVLINNSRFKMKDVEYVDSKECSIIETDRVKQENYDFNLHTDTQEQTKSNKPDISSKEVQQDTYEDISEGESDENAEKKVVTKPETEAEIYEEDYEDIEKDDSDERRQSNATEELGNEENTETAASQLDQRQTNSIVGQADVLEEVYEDIDSKSPDISKRTRKSIRNKDARQDSTYAEISEDEDELVLNKDETSNKNQEHMSSEMIQNREKAKTPTICTNIGEEVYEEMDSTENSKDSMEISVENTEKASESREVASNDSVSEQNLQPPSARHSQLSYDDTYEDFANISDIRRPEVAADSASEDDVEGNS